MKSTACPGTFKQQPPASDVEKNLTSQPALLEQVEDNVKTTNIPGKLICFVNDNQNLIKVQCSINGIKSLATVDSGASRSIINKDLMHKVSLEPSPCRDKLNALGDGNIPVVGKVQGLISMGKIDIGTTEFLVIDNQLGLENLFILGMDFLIYNNIEICPKQRKLIQHRSEGGFVELYFDESGDITTRLLQKLPCYSIENVTIQEGTSHNLNVKWCNLALNDDDLLLYAHEDKTNSKGHLMTLSGIYDTSANNVVCFASEKDVKIKEGQQIGYLSTMVELPNTETDDDNSQIWTLAKIKDEIKLPLLNCEQQDKVYQMIHDVLQSDHRTIEPASVTKHHISLYEHTPIYQKPRRFPTPIANEIERQCSELTSADIIEPSVSPYSSPIVPVRKKMEPSDYVLTIAS